MRIRPEAEADRAAVRAVNEAAFETPAEADLVEALHRKEKSLVSLIAEVEGRVVGHILFSPVSLAEHAHLNLMGLAPMAVLPDCQRQGIGSALVRQGLAHCKDLGFCAVVVVGHADYYPRFGFVPADRYGLRSEYDVPADVFMVAELESGALNGASGWSAMTRRLPAYSKQLRRTVTPHRRRAACASFHCARAPRFTLHRAAAELRR